MSMLLLFSSQFFQANLQSPRDKVKLDHSHNNFSISTHPYVNCIQAWSKCPVSEILQSHKLKFEPVWVNKYLKNQFIGLSFSADCFLPQNNCLNVSSTFRNKFAGPKSETSLISNTFPGQNCQVELCIKCCKAAPPEAEQAVSFLTCIA